jgi:hypothetical protein
VTSRIFDTIAPTWVQDSSALGNTFEFAHAFSVSVDQFLVELSWYRSATGSQNTPAYLRVWDAVTNATIYDAPIIPDNGSVGWQRHTVGSQITLAAGRQYRVAIVWLTGQHDTQASTGSGSPSSPISLASPYRYYNAALGFPNTTPFGATWIGVDVGVDSSPPAGTTPPNPGTSSSGELANWLITTGDNQHQSDGLPWRTDANVTTVEALATGGSGFAATKTAVDSVLTSVGSGIGAAVATIGTTVSSINSTLVSHVNTWSATLAATLQQMSDDVAAFLGGRLAQGGGSTGSSDFPGTSGPLTWTLVDSVDFTHVKSWDVAADLYTLSTASWPENRPMVDVDGAPWRPRLGWWAPRNGDLLGDRRFIDWDNSYLEDQGRRMPGIAIWLEGETTGHLEAWTLT